MDMPPQGPALPSAWVQRWTHLIRPGGTVLDVACGSGRHMQWLAQHNLRVTGVDRSRSALQQARAWGCVLEADIEAQAWPLMDNGIPRRYDALIVVNYLWRALFPVLKASLQPGGVIIYETFAQGQETLGKPSRPAFLLQHGELLRVFADWRIVAYEEGFLNAPDRFIQRMVALHEAPPQGIASAARYALAPVARPVQALGRMSG